MDKDRDIFLYIYKHTKKAYTYTHRQIKVTTNKNIHTYIKTNKYTDTNTKTNTHTYKQTNKRLTIINLKQTKPTQANKHSLTPKTYINEQPQIHKYTKDNTQKQKPTQ